MSTLKRINKIILVALFLSTFIIYGLSFVTPTTNLQIGSQKVCAAGELDTGLNCVPNVATCNNGYPMIGDAAFTSLLQGGMTLENFQTSVKDTTKRDGNGNVRFVIHDDYENIKQKVCVSKLVKSIIPAYKGNEGGDKDIPEDLSAYYGTTLTTIFTIPRACANDSDKASQSPVGSSGYGNPWGCCPSTTTTANTAGYTYQFFMGEGMDRTGGGLINVGNAFKPTNKGRNLTACCPTIAGNQPAHYYPEAYDGHPAGCLDVNYNIVSPVGDPSIITTTSPGFEIWGYGLNSAPWMFDGDISGSAMKCADGLPCALQSDGKIVLAGNLPNDPAIKCTKCFSAGEAIKIAANGNIVRCQPGSKNAAGEPVDEIGVCNNSASDTIACLTAGKADTQNFKLCCACREHGGVWTGIGCTDTTPVGVITGIIRIVFGVVGGVALLQLIIAGIMYQTGDETKIKEARENIIRTLTGLAVLVFSILILRVIGINVLDILPAGSI